MTTIPAMLAEAVKVPDAAQTLRADRRALRVMLFVLAIWALNGIDLFFTALACQLGDFVELNPLARHMAPQGLVAFKLACLATFSIGFYRCRRHRCTEWGCYLVLAVYAAVTAIWLTMYHFLLSADYIQPLLARLW
jgi:hypothetical protein